MSLQVWLPLNGDLHNQGLSNQTVNVTTTPVWSTNGKIGSKSLYTKTRMTTMYFPALAGVSTYSVAYWVYIPTEIAPTAWSDIFGIQFNCGGTNVWERDERRAATTVGRHNYHLAKSASEGSNTNAYYGTIEDDSANDKWVHVTVTKDDTNAKLYFNAVLQTTIANSAFENNPRTMTGNVYLGDGGCEAYLQDFRIYDHCLSPRECKQVSTALVLHYPLSMPGQENLIANSRTFSGWSINSLFTVNQISTGEYVASASRTGATSNLWNRVIPTVRLNPASYPDGVTASFDFKCDDINALDHKCICSLQIYNSSGTRIGWYEAKNTFTEANYVGSATLKNGVWKRLTCYFTQSNLKNISISDFTVNDVSYTMLSFNLVKNGSVSFKNIKLELGSIATPWIPNTADIEYTKIGFNSNIEYDCSGYNYNGTKTAVTYSSDTPRYNASSVFNGSTSKIVSIKPTFIKEAVTFAYWAYMDDWNNGAIHSAFSAVQSGGFGNQGHNTLLQLQVCTGTSSVTWAVYACNGSDLSPGWHHFAGTYDGFTFKAYVDGVEKYTKTIYTTKTPIYYNTSATSGYLFVGGESGASATTPDDYFNGKVSDARVYATALSASDILELYHTPISVANNGTLLTQGEFVEV